MHMTMYILDWALRVDKPSKFELDRVVYFEDVSSVDERSSGI